MGAKQAKRYRKVIDKATFQIAQQQLLEIMKAPFLYRFKYCWAILFPPKHVRKMKADLKKAHGKETIKRANERNNKPDTAEAEKVLEAGADK